MERYFPIYAKDILSAYDKMNGKLHSTQAFEYAWIDSIDLPSEEIENVILN